MVTTNAAAPTVETKAQFVARLKRMSLDEILVFMHTPRPYNPKINSAALILAELSRRNG